MISSGLMLEPCSQPVTLVSQVTSLMIEPDYDLKKIKGDSRRKSAVLAPEREIFSAKSEEDEAPRAQERLPARPRRLPPRRPRAPSSSHHSSASPYRSSATPLPPLSPATPLARLHP